MYRSNNNNKRGNLRFFFERKVNLKGLSKILLYKGRVVRDDEKGERERNLINFAFSSCEFFSSSWFETEV